MTQNSKYVRDSVYIDGTDRPTHWCD